MSRLSEKKTILIYEDVQKFFLNLWEKETGGFKFASQQSSTLMATSYSVLGLEFIGALKYLSKEQRCTITAFLMSGSRSDGSFQDPLFCPKDVMSTQHDLAYFHEETTTFCQQALDALLAPPPPPRSWSNGWNTSDGLICYFESLSWRDAWLDSNRVMFALSQLCHDAERHQKPELLDVVDTALDWLDAHQNPQTGLWQGSHEVSLTNAMAATFHFTFYYGYRNRPLLYVERIIDSCLALQEKHGLFSGSVMVGQTCLDYDAIDLLAKATLNTSYRSDEVQACLAQAHDSLLALYNPEDGGFANCKSRIEWDKGAKRIFRGGLRKLGFAKLFPAFTYVHSTGLYNVCWKFLSCRDYESNAFSTWLRLLSLRLSTQNQWMEENESPVEFNFRRLPFLGYHDLAAMGSKRVESTSVT